MCVGGVCQCYPGFGQTFLYRAISTGIDTPPELVPVFPNGSDVPGCPFEGASGCDPTLMTYINDCGGLDYVPGDAIRLAGAVRAVLAAAILALLIMIDDNSSI